ncbi:MAG: hypothetical protein RJA09_1380 [Pseudomonadota bacterium]
MSFPSLSNRTSWCLLTAMPCAMMLFFPGGGSAQLLDAAHVQVQSSVMRGFPPALENRVVKANAFTPQNLRWSLSHGRELAPTREINRSDKPMVLLQGQPLALDTVTFTVGQDDTTLGDYLQATVTDGFIVLHKGRVVYQRSFGGIGARQPHTWASMVKSVTGLLAAQFIVEGKLDPQARLAQYVPELAGTPFGDATVQQNLDMEVAVTYPDGVPPDLGLFAAAGLIPRREGMPEDIYAFLKVAQRPQDAQGARRFFYQNGSAEAIAWALRRISGQSWAALVSERVWSRFALDDAYVHVDVLGTEMSSGGLNCNLEDTARFAELIRREFARQERGDSFTQAVREIFRPRDNQALFAAGNLAVGRSGYSYGDYWYQINDGMGSMEANGRFGQRIYINPARQLVVVKLSSAPDVARRSTSAAGPGRTFDRAMDSPAAFNNMIAALLKAIPQ